MKWPLALFIAALLAAGCRTPAPTFDPFAGRTTVPPPGTGSLAPPAVSVPYYQGAPPPGSAPTTYPNTVPPGGYDYPQGSYAPAAPESYAQAPAEIQIPEEMTRPIEQAQPIVAAAEPAPRASEPTVRVPDDSEDTRFQLPAIAATVPEVSSPAPLAMPSQPAARLVPYQPRVVEPAPSYAVTPQPIVTQVSAPQPVPRQIVVQPAVAYAAAPMIDPCSCEPQPFVAAPGAVEITQLPATRVQASIPPADASRSLTVSSGTSASGASAAASGTTRFAVQQASHETPVKAAFQQLSHRYGYESDYRSIKGKLEYLQSTQQWKLRYIPIDGETDEFGGSVLIDNPEALAGLEPGAFVTLYGQITHEPVNAKSFAPLYLVERVAQLK